MKSTLSCSVVIPAYNSADTILLTLKSILLNIRDSDEIIVVDDGSSDNTVSVCTGLDDRIKVVSQQNAGPGVARNRGIDLSSGELVAFCDDDDLWDTGKLEKQRKLFEQNPGLGLCFTDYRVVSQSGEVKTASAVADRKLPLEHSLESMLVRNPVMTSSVVALRYALQEAGGFPDCFDRKLNVNLACEDYEAWIGMAERYPVAMVPDVLASYVVDDSGAFRALHSNRSAHAAAIKRRVHFIRRVAKNNRKQVSRGVVREALGDYFFRAAYSDREEGLLASSAVLLIKSIMQWPLRAKSWVCLGYVAWLGLKKWCCQLKTNRARDQADVLKR